MSEPASFTPVNPESPEPYQLLQVTKGRELNEHDMWLIAAVLREAENALDVVGTGASDGQSNDNDQIIGGLALRRAHVTPEMLQILSSEGLSRAARIERLDLSHNPLTGEGNSLAGADPKGVHELAEALARRARVRALALRECGLAETAVALLKTLAPRSPDKTTGKWHSARASLRELDLSENELDDQAKKTNL